MATRTRKNASAIDESVDTAPAVETVETDTAPAVETPTVETDPTDPAGSEDTAPAVLSYVIDGVTHTVDPDRLDGLALSVGAGRLARHDRALTVGRFIADHSGMTPNRAHGMLRAAGHYVHRDTVNGAANAYALTVEFLPVTADTADPGEFLADVLSLIDAVGIRKIRGTHNNVSVIGYDGLTAVTDPIERAAAFRAAVLAALSAARNVGLPTDPTDPAGSDSTEETEETEETGDDTAPADIPAMWSNALADIAAAIHTAGALTASQRAALEAGARAVLTALDDTADRTVETVETVAA